MALYVSGQLLTEDYYVANKLMKGYVGTANIDTNSRLCMSSAVAGHKRAFGEDLVPGLLRGPGTGRHGGTGRLQYRLVPSDHLPAHRARRKEARPEMKLVVIDPRRTATCELADLHLPVRSGTDVWLFNGLLSFLHQHGVMDAGFVDRAHQLTSPAPWRSPKTPPVDVRSVARGLQGVASRTCCEFYRLFARTEKVITAFSQGVNQSSAGTDKVNSIINCHLLTGRIGKPGMGPFSITGQPNAMGGREVGGLANMLAAHMDLGQPQAPRHRAGRSGTSPRIADKPGLKAVDLFNAIESGKVKVVWIMATNPVVSLPDADQAKRALAKCELVISSDIIEKTDTNSFAHVLLPALGWGDSVLNFDVDGSEDHQLWESARAQRHWRYNHRSAGSPGPRAERRCALLRRLQQNNRKVLAASIMGMGHSPLVTSVTPCSRSLCSLFWQANPVDGPPHFRMLMISNGISSITARPMASPQRHTRTRSSGKHPANRHKAAEKADVIPAISSSAGKVVEAISGMSLDQYVKTTFTIS